MTAIELLRQSIDRSRQADPHVIARSVFARLAPDQSKEAALIGLEWMARKEVGSVGRALKSPGPARRLLAMRDRVCPGGVWKFLDDCGADDLEVLAAEYRQRSRELEDRAVEADQMRAELVESGCKTLGEMRMRAAA